jgi:hypothetical protein
LSSNPRSSHDLREDPQLKEENPQLTPKISQVVEPLQGYISKLSHGERGTEKGESHQTYDLISGARTEIFWRQETYDLIGSNR